MVTAVYRFSHTLVTYYNYTGNRW